MEGIVLALIVLALVGWRLFESRPTSRCRAYRPVTWRHHSRVALRPPEKKKARSAAEVSGIVGDFPAARVIRIIDGDTVTVETQWRRMTIRLDSIDCPEDGQHWGDTASYGLIKMIGGRTVRLEEHGLDSHGRTLATIYVRHANGHEWVNVNERMVTLGHAWVMRRFYDHLPRDRQEKLNRLEDWAKSKRVGLWRTQDPVPPWHWRRRKMVQ